MNKVTVLHLNTEAFDKLTSARLLVSLASNLGIRDLVLRMLVKDIVNLDEFILSLKNM